MIFRFSAWDTLSLWASNLHISSYQRLFILPPCALSTFPPSVHTSCPVSLKRATLLGLPCSILGHTHNPKVTGDCPPEFCFTEAEIKVMTDELRNRHGWYCCHAGFWQANTFLVSWDLIRRYWRWHREIATGRVSFKLTALIARYGDTHQILPLHAHMRTRIYTHRLCHQIFAQGTSIGWSWQQSTAIFLWWKKEFGRIKGGAQSMVEGVTAPSQFSRESGSPSDDVFPELLPKIISTGDTKALTRLHHAKRTPSLCCQCWLVPAVQGFSWRSFSDLLLHF